MSSPLVMYSHRIENLAAALSDLLDQSVLSPGKKSVLVPSLEMKNWLMMFLVKRSSKKAFLGIDFIDIKSLDQFFAQFLDVKKNFPSPLELSLSIQKVLETLLLEYDKTHDEQLAPLAKFFENESGKRKTKKFCELSHYVSHLFLQIRKVEKNLSWPVELLWQKRVWELVQEKENISNPLEDFLHAQIHIDRLPEQIHLFGYHYIFPIDHELLKKFPCQIFHYLFSPCRQFWSDLVSLKTPSYLFSSSQENQKEFLNFQREQNIFLLNFGKVGRKTGQMIEQYEYPTLELYAERKKEKSILSQLQADILDNVSGEDFFAKNPDDSLVICQASSKVAEIENFCEFLIHQSKDKNFDLEDILVLVTDINGYYPFLKAHLDLLNIPYKVSGLLIKEHSSFIMGVLTFLDMVVSESFFYKFFDLLKNPSFYCKQGMTYEEVEILLEWIESFSIFPLEQIPEAMEKTIEGLLSILQGIISPYPTSFGPKPKVVAEYFSCELIHKALALFRAFKEDAEFFLNNPLCLVKEGALWIEKIVEKYFKVEMENFFEKKGKDIFDNVIQKFCTLIEENESKHSLGSLLFLFQKELSSKKCSLGYEYGRAITVLPLEQGAVRSASLIFVLGLDDHFPKAVVETSLNPFSKEVLSSLDHDRFLFLQIFMNAKEKLYLSYNIFSKKEGASRNPSSVLLDLLSTLKNRYKIDQMLSEKDNFKETGISLNKRPSVFSIIKEKKVADNKRFSEISIEKLMRFARHPLRSFCQSELNLYLSYPDEKTFEKNFSFLEKQYVQKSLIQKEPSEVFADFKKTGRCSDQISQIFLKNLLEKEDQKIGKALKNFGVKKSDIFTLLLHASCDSPYWRLPSIYVVPALTLNGGFSEIKIVGEINNCCQKGLLFFAKKNFSEEVKYRPLQLIFSSVSFPFEKKCVWLEDGYIDDPRSFKDLEKYISYYVKAQTFPSIFLPSVAESFLTKDRKEIKKAIEKEAKKEFPYPDLYLQKFCENMSDKDWEEMLQLWPQDYFVTLFDKKYDM